MKQALQVHLESGSQPQKPFLDTLMLARVLDVGGIERDVSKYSRLLSRKGFRPHVGCFNPGGMRWKEIEAAGVPVLEVPVHSFRSRSALDGARILHRYVRDHQIRLIHTFDVTASIFAVPLARLWGLPVLSSQVSYRFLSDPQIRLFMGVIDRLASGIFVNCEAMANHLKNDFNVPDKKVHICYNGFEPEEFDPTGRRRVASVKDASVVVGTVAVLRPEKNLGMLIEAFAQLLHVERRARLLLVGDGPVQTELEQRTFELGIREACIFQQKVEKPADWMRSMDIFVLPSRSEAFSNSLLEAMACGCCPVASRVGGLPEMVVHRERGLLFESGNVQELAAALIELTTQPQLRESLATEATRFVMERLTMEAAASRLAGIYKQVLGMPLSNREEEFVPLRRPVRQCNEESNAAVSCGD